MKTKPISVKTQAIIAWRAWLPGERTRLKQIGQASVDGLLLAVTAPHRPWERGANRASCDLVARHAPPVPRCDCGYYGVDLACLDDVVREIGNVVIGAAFFWGRVVRHARGVRAEYAAVGCLIGDGYEMRRVAERYGVPLVASIEESLAWARAQDAVVLASRPYDAPPPVNQHPAR